MAIVTPNDLMEMAKKQKQLHTKQHLLMTKMDSTKDRFFVRFNSKKSTQAAVNQEPPLQEQF